MYFSPNVRFSENLYGSFITSGRQTGVNFRFFSFKICDLRSLVIPRSGPTRSHPEHGSETLQSRW